MSKLKFTICVLLAVVLVAPLAFAQMGTGRVTGSVSDTQGNPITGAVVTASGGGQSFEATTGEDGKWTLMGFRSGSYEFTVQAEGFQPQAYKQPIRGRGRNPSMDFVLEPQQTGGGGSSMLGEANELFESGQYAEAIAKYEALLAENPTMYQIHYNMGLAYRESEDLENAVKQFQMVLDEEPTHSGALIGTGDAMVQQQNFDEAVSYFEKAIELTSDHIVPFNVAEIYFNRGEAAKAIEFYTVASQRKTDWPDPHLKMGYAYLNTGDMEGAKAAFEKVVEVAPDTPQAQMAQAALSSLQ